MGDWERCGSEYVRQCNSNGRKHIPRSLLCHVPRVVLACNKWRGMHVRTCIHPHTHTHIQCVFSHVHMCTHTCPKTQVSPVCTPMQVRLDAYWTHSPTHIHAIAPIACTHTGSFAPVDIHSYSDTYSHRQTDVHHTHTYALHVSITLSTLVFTFAHTRAPTVCAFACM